MTRLYLAPVGDDWYSRFTETVKEPVDLTSYQLGEIKLPTEIKEASELRIWGTTEGEQKQQYFQEMQTGDPVLFYRDSNYFASARVEKTVRSAALGQELWGSADSVYIYTLTDYKEHQIAPQQVNDILGYSEGYIPMGFMRISQNAIGSLLTAYNSTEEAFQTLREENADTEPVGENEDDKQELTDDDPRRHTVIQWYLIQLGLIHGYDVYVAKNDRSRMYDGEELGQDCVDELTLAGFSDAAAKIIEYVDVIWLDDEFIVKLFEVEHTTSIYSGILRMTDFVVKVPNIAVDMHIVAPQTKADKVRKEINRPTFQQVLEPAEHSTLSYLSFDDVEQQYELVKEAGPLQHVFQSD